MICLAGRGCNCSEGIQLIFTVYTEQKILRPIPAYFTWLSKLTQSDFNSVNLQEQFSSAKFKSSGNNSSEKTSFSSTKFAQKRSHYNSWCKFCLKASFWTIPISDNVLKFGRLRSAHKTIAVIKELNKRETKRVRTLAFRGCCYMLRHLFILNK